MTEPTDNNPQPRPCPDWCVMHIDGRHVGELELAAELNGYNIYTRPVDYDDDGVGLEVIVSKPEGTHTRRVLIGPAEVTAAAVQAAFQQVADGFNNDTPGDDR